VRLSNGREFFAKTVISNATRWDTFGNPAHIFFHFNFHAKKTKVFSVSLVEIIDFLFSSCQENC
jgi:hypothetical protein